MPGYISLLKYTPKAIADLKGSPQRVEDAKATAGKMGVRWVAFWSTAGAYDAVCVIDAANDEAASAFFLAQASKGYVSTQSMRAYSETEWAALVNKLP